MNKDLETFNTIAKELHVPVSFANIAQRYQQAALAAGLGVKVTSVILSLIERLAGVSPPGGEVRGTRAPDRDLPSPPQAGARALRRGSVSHVGRVLPRRVPPRPAAPPL